VEDGGLLVTITNVSQIPIDYGITTGVTIQESRQLQARGSVYNATFADRKSPIAYGYGESLPVYFNQAPLLQISALPRGFGGGGGGGGGFGGGGGATGQRASGRGSVSDPDVIQGRPQPAPQPSQRPAQRPGAPGEEQIPDEVRQFLGPMITPPALRPRVVL